jgi:hypothetical protein
MPIMHNRGDLQRENPLSLKDFTELKIEFENLEKILKDAQKRAKKIEKKKEERQKRQLRLAGHFHY